MQTATVSAMLQSCMRPDEVQSIVELAVLRHIYVCSDVNMSLSRSWCCILVGNDGIEEYVYGSWRVHL